MLQHYTKHLKGITNLFAKTADELGVKLEKQDLLEFVKVLSHYQEHAKRHNLEVTAMEPYKIISWGGLSLCQNYKNIQSQKATFILVSVILTLHYVLKLDTNRNFDTSFLKKTLKMIIYECKNDDTFGVGKNGLYMIFKGALNICSK